MSESQVVVNSNPIESSTSHEDMNGRNVLFDGEVTGHLLPSGLINLK